ncbi:MAG TPA: hypothetical protein VNA44_01200 [Burkholderiaceae bacterium]|nr:hypothetical protein [Burkholderiaceae bacterium]
MTDRLNARIAVPLLAIMGALSGCGGGDTGSTTGPAPAPTQVAAATCATPPQLFTNTVWPSMSSTCVVCHRSGAVASGTKLVFAAGGTVEANYGVLRTFASTNSDLLMSKSIGLPTHTGGAPFGNANSQQYKDLASLLPKLKESCSTEVIATGEFWSKIKFADDQTTLQKAANLFAARNPTSVEKTAVAGGGEAVLRQQIRGYMDGPAFDAFLTEAGQVQFLVNRAVIFGGGRGLNAADWPLAAAVINNQNPPAGVRARFETAMRMEPIHMMKYIVKSERPWTDIVAGKYTALPEVASSLLGGQVQGTYMDPTNDNEVLPVVLPNTRFGGNRDQAGVMTTHAMLDAFPTADVENHNRHRVAEMSKRFLALYIPELAARPLEDGQFRVAVMDNPGCAVCHDIMDPMAAGFQNYGPDNRFRSRGGAGTMAHALGNYYLDTDYPLDAKGNRFYQTGDNWYRVQKAPGFGNTLMPNGYNNPKAAEWLGDQMAADSRFALGAVHFWWKATFHREPLRAPTDSTGPDAAARLAAYNAQHDEFKQIAAGFAAGGYKVKDLLVALVMSKHARAIGSTEPVSAQRASTLAAVGQGNLLSAARLNRKFVGLVGSQYDAFANPLAGAALAYSNFDANVLKVVQQDFTSSQVSVSDGAAVRNVCRWTNADFAKAPAARLLFPSVTMTDTPANKAGSDKIQENLVYLFSHLWNQRVSVTDPEVQRAYQFMVDVYNDRNTAAARPAACELNNGNDANYAGRMWAAAVMYFIGDPAFLSH